MSSEYVLGISAYYHDSAACLIRDGKPIAAAQEERFTRLKGDASFPVNAALWCLRHEGVSASDLSAVAYYEKPLLKFERIVDTFLSAAPRGVASFTRFASIWLTDRLFLEDHLRSALGFDGPVLYGEHHKSHAASAFFPSPFESAAVLTVDGVGEWATASIGIGKQGHLELIQELRWPHSLGLLYSAFTYYLGFAVNSGEQKVMGLAAYGKPKYADRIYDHLVHVKEDGSLELNLEYFDYVAGLKMTSRRFDRLFGAPRRSPDSAISRYHMDVASSVQAVCEEVILRMARTAFRATGCRRICLAGGVALNCVANGRLLNEGPFERVWIQPAAGDAGRALGVALLAWHEHMGHARNTCEARDGMSGAYLGPAYEPSEITSFLDRRGARYRVCARDTIIEETARALANDKVVGWYCGRMEFGPRALGARSILANPGNQILRDRINQRVKHREWFRPFGASILEESASALVDHVSDSPYMLLVAPVRRYDVGAGGDAASSPIPAVTHVDGTTRIQTVAREVNPTYYDLILRFAELTGIPALLNTSFNVRGKPIVCTPEDAYECFVGSDLDMLVLWPCILRKGDQTSA